MKEHQFILEAHWDGGLHGRGNIESGNLKTEVSVPTSLGGPGAGTNPEELLLGAAGTCYLITLAAILQRREVKLMTLSLRSEGTVFSEPPVLKLTRIVHRPKMVVAGLTSELQTQLKELANQAEKYCLVSNSLRGNVEVLVAPEIS
jgi:peroxiredoxin-like protein